MPKQDQHIIPQVYLKQFGFQKREYNNKWFVSVKNLKNGKWQNREIKAFLTVNNLYKFQEFFPSRINLIEEALNGGIEQRIPLIISVLKRHKKINYDRHLDIAETTANFLCRTEMVRGWLSDWCNKSDLKLRRLFDFITEGNFTDIGIANHVFNVTNSLLLKDKINCLMVDYMMYVKKVLSHASLTILECTGDHKLFTSDNPVCLMNVGYGEISTKPMEIYFPLSAKYLAYFYFDKSISKMTTLIPKLESGTKIKFDEESINYYTRSVLPSRANNFIISPIDFSLLGIS